MDRRGGEALLPEENWERGTFAQPGRPPVLTLSELSWVRSCSTKGSCGAGAHFPHPTMWKEPLLKNSNKAISSNCKTLINNLEMYYLSLVYLFPAGLKVEDRLFCEGAEQPQAIPGGRHGGKGHSLTR